MIISICTLSFVYPNQQGLILKNSMCLKPEEESWVFSCLGWCLRLIELCCQNNGFMPILDRCSCLNENGCDPCPAYEPLGSKTAAIRFMAAKTNPSQEDHLHFSSVKFIFNHVSSIFLTKFIADKSIPSARNTTTLHTVHTSQSYFFIKFFNRRFEPCFNLKLLTIFWDISDTFATIFLNYISQLHISTTFPIRAMARTNN